MNNTPPHFAIASPTGDIPVTDIHLEMTLEGCPEKTSYKHYFDSIQHILATSAKPTIDSLAQNTFWELATIKSEKHGAFYHPASLEIQSNNKRPFRVGLLAATSPLGRDSLREEFRIMNRLAPTTPGDFLPRFYSLHETDDMTFALVEWLTGFHEFHVRKKGYVLWDYDHGNKELTDEQVGAIMQQATAILTTLYDVKDGSMVHPWHHAAGDFVVRLDNGTPKVKLTTIRGYTPLFEESERPDQIIALLFFFLDTSLRMRLDRIDGTETMTWLHDFAVQSCIHGFFDGLENTPKKEMDISGVLTVFSSLSSDQLEAACDMLLPSYGKEELELIQTHITEHCHQVEMFLNAYKQKQP